MNPEQQLELDADWILKEFGDIEGRGILRELQHYNLYGQLPPNAVFIERVEWVNGSAIIVHADPDVRQ